MDTRKQMENRLKQLQTMRLQVEAMDKAMQALTPEERLVVERMLIHPAAGSVQELCQILGVEQTSVYRRKYKALDKLIGTLGS